MIKIFFKRKDVEKIKLEELKNKWEQLIQKERVRLITKGDDYHAFINNVVVKSVFEYELYHEGYIDDPLSCVDVHLVHSKTKDIYIFRYNNINRKWWHARTLNQASSQHKTSSTFIDRNLLNELMN